MTGTARSDVYGASVSSTGEESTFGYTGQQTDDTGLLFLRNRMYEPRTGRFATADVVTANGFGTNGFSMFGYGEGAPSQNTDILGLGINLGGYISNVNSAKTFLNLTMSLAWNTYVAAQNCETNSCIGAKVAVSGALTLALATTPHLPQMNRFLGALVGCPIGIVKDALVVGPASNLASGAGGWLPSAPGAITACVRGAIVGAAFPPTG